MRAQKARKWWFEMAEKGGGWVTVSHTAVAVFREERVNLASACTRRKLRSRISLHTCSIQEILHKHFCWINLTPVIEWEGVRANLTKGYESLCWPWPCMQESEFPDRTVLKSKIFSGSWIPLEKRSPVDLLKKDLLRMLSAYWLRRSFFMSFSGAFQELYLGSFQDLFPWSFQDLFRTFSGYIFTSWF